MQIQQLGHVVIKVSNLKAAEDFYSGILGLPIVARTDGGEMTFFSLGNHHDFAIAAVGDDAPRAPRNAVGLAHVAFKIGDDMATLLEARDHLAQAGVATSPIDHEVTKSLYFADPDGNVVELYIDAADTWRKDPQRVAQSRALEL